MKQERYLLHVDEWLKHLERKGKSRYTRERSYRNSVMRAYRVLKEAGFQTGPSRLGEEAILYVIKEGFNLRASEVSAFIMFLKFCGNAKLELMQYPLPKRPRFRVDWLNTDAGEDWVVWEAADGTMERAITFHELLMGLRRTSVMRFQTAWFIKAREPKDDVDRVLGKGHGDGKWRTVPCHPYARDVMREVEEYRADLLHQARRLRPAPVLPGNMMAYNQYGWKLGSYREGALDGIIKRVSKKAHTPLSNHTLRRTFGRSMWQSGVDIAKIAKVMGHDDYRQTIEYLGLNLQDAQEAMQQFAAWSENRRTLFCAPRQIAASNPI